MNDPLVWVRAVHFAATIAVSGVLFFRAFIADPALRKAGGKEDIVAVVQSRLAWFGWISLVLVPISGAAWLFFVAARMVDVPLVDAFSDGTLWTVVTGTDFGHAWIVRLFLAGLLGVALFPVRYPHAFANINLAVTLQKPRRYVLLNVSASTGGEVL